MRLVSLDRPQKGNQSLFFILNFKKSSKFLAAKYKKASNLLILLQTACIDSFLPIGWHTFIWWKKLPKYWTILVWIARYWNSSNILFTSRNSKNNCWLSLIFKGRLGRKDCGLCPYNQSAEEVGRLEVFLYGEVDVLFKAYPMVSL